MSDPIYCPHCGADTDGDLSDHGTTLSMAGGDAYYCETACMKCNTPFVIEVSVIVYTEVLKEMPASIAALLEQKA